MAFLGHGQAHMVGQLSTGALTHLHLNWLRSTVHACSGHTCSLPHAMVLRRGCSHHALLTGLVLPCVGSWHRLTTRWYSPWHGVVRRTTWTRLLV